MFGAAPLSLLRLALCSGLAGAVPLDDCAALLQKQPAAPGEPLVKRVHHQHQHHPHHHHHHRQHPQQEQEEARALQQQRGSQCLSGAVGHDCGSCEARVLGPPKPLAPKATRVAIFAQVFNQALYGEMAQCIEKVADAALQSHRNLDVHVALVHENATIAEHVQMMDGSSSVSHASLQLVENAGADIGQFMQQLMRSQAEHKEYDVILKIHSKSSEVWRTSALGSLCGSADQVLKIFEQFDGNQNIGMVGPLAWTWMHETNPLQAMRGLDLLARQEEGLKWMENKEVQSWMREAWVIIFPCEMASAFPSPTDFAIVAGTIYWSRAYPLLQNEGLTAAIPRFLEVLPRRFSTRSKCRSEGCRLMFALERVIPTMIKARYRLKVETAPNNTPPKGWVPRHKPDIEIDALRHMFK